MSDWRANPRQGRSKFLPLIDEIKERLKNGETQKMIYESYPTLGMGYPQFTRYVKKYCIEQDERKAKYSASIDVSQKKHTTGQKQPELSQRKARNPADLKKLRAMPIDLEELQNIAGDKNESSDS